MSATNLKKTQELTNKDKEELKKAVKKTVKEYKVTLELLAKS